MNGFDDSLIPQAKASNFAFSENLFRSPHIFSFLQYSVTKRLIHSGKFWRSVAAGAGNSEYVHKLLFTCNCWWEKALLKDEGRINNYRRFRSMRAALLCDKIVCRSWECALKRAPLLVTVRCISAAGAALHSNSVRDTIARPPSCHGCDSVPTWSISSMFAPRFLDANLRANPSSSNLITYSIK